MQLLNDAVALCARNPFILYAVAASTSVLMIRYRNLSKTLKSYLSTDVSFEICRANPIAGVRTVLVTGGCGFLGKNIVNALVKNGLNVVVFDVLIPDESLRIKSVTYIRGNILNAEHIERAITLMHPNAIESVFHTASLIPYLGVPEEAIRTVNIEGAKNLVTVCSRFNVKYFIYTSSATAVLEKNNRVARNITEEVSYPQQHVDLYACTKATAERLVLAANDPQGMITCVLRPTAIFGPGDKAISDKLKKGEDRFFIGSGTSLLDWVPVQHVALAHVLAEEALATDADRRRRMQGAVYFVGNNEEHSYGWFMGDTRDPASHWGHPPASSLPLPVVNALAYLNLFIHFLLGVRVLPPGLAPSLIDFTQRTYTFRSDRAARDFGYRPPASVADSIRALVHDEASRARAA